MRSSDCDKRGFNNFIKSILPPPPDVRRVVVKQPTVNTIQEWALVDVPEIKEQFGITNSNYNSYDSRSSSSSSSDRNVSSGHAAEVDNNNDSNSSGSSSEEKSKRHIGRIAKQNDITALNTTIIGDYTATVFPAYHTKWLVQAWGNATLASTMESIDNKLVTVDRRYIFLALGGNQLRTSTRQSVSMQVLELVSKIRDKNEESRIFFVGVLPRPVENAEVKPLIVKFNRFLMQAVEKAAVIFDKVWFLPAHLEFISDGVPVEEFFHQDDRLTLNERGAILFRNTLFRLAGFRKND